MEWMPDVVLGRPPQQTGSTAPAAGAPAAAAPRAAAKEKKKSAKAAAPAAAAPSSSSSAAVGGGGGGGSSSGSSVGGIYVAPTQVKMRAGADLASAEAGSLPEGTLVCVVDEKVLEDGTKRVRVVVDGHADGPRGWVTESKLGPMAGGGSSSGGGGGGGGGGDAGSTSGIFSAPTQVKMRAGAELTSAEAGSLPEGTRVVVMQEKVLDDGTKRVRVAVEGHATPRGWVTFSKLERAPYGSGAAGAAEVAPPPRPGLPRGGTLVKLKGLEKKYDNQVGRVVEMNGPLQSEGPDGSVTEMVAVLLAPKGRHDGVWVAVPLENIEVQP